MRYFVIRLKVNVLRFRVEFECLLTEVRTNVNTVVEMEFSHRNLDPLGRKKKGTLTPVARTVHHIQLL